MLGGDLVENRDEAEPTGAADSDDRRAEGFVPFGGAPGVNCDDARLMVPVSSAGVERVPVADPREDHAPRLAPRQRTEQDYALKRDDGPPPGLGDGPSCAPHRLGT